VVGGVQFCPQRIVLLLKLTDKDTKESLDHALLGTPRNVRNKACFEIRREREAELHFNTGLVVVSICGWSGWLKVLI